MLVIISVYIISLLKKRPNICNVPFSKYTLNTWLLSVQEFCLVVLVQKQFDMMGEVAHQTTNLRIYAKTKSSFV